MASIKGTKSPIGGGKRMQGQKPSDGARIHDVKRDGSGNTNTSPSKVTGKKGREIKRTGK